MAGGARRDQPGDSRDAARENGGWLVVAGLSPRISVFDPAVFSPEVEPSGADVISNAAPERGVHAEIGGYIVVARQPDAWDASVDVLLALELWGYQCTFIA